MNKTKSIILLTITLTLILVLTSSCTKMPIQRTHLLLENVKKQHSTRSENYLECLSRLNKEGVKQGLLKTLCDSSYGTIDD